MAVSFETLRKKMSPDKAMKVWVEKSKPTEKEFKDMQKKLQKDVVSAGKELKTQMKVLGADPKSVEKFVTKFYKLPTEQKKEVFHKLQQAMASKDPEKMSLLLSSILDEPALKKSASRRMMRRNAPQKKKGDVWETDGGWGAINQKGAREYFKEKKDAEIFAKGSGETSSQIDTSEIQQDVASTASTVVESIWLMSVMDAFTDVFK